MSIFFELDVRDNDGGFQDVAAAGTDCVGSGRVDFDVCGTATVAFQVV